MWCLKIVLSDQLTYINSMVILILAIILGLNDFSGKTGVWWENIWNY